MPIPSLPSGYDETKHLGTGRADCHLTVGFDRDRDRVLRFLVILHYRQDADTARWDEIARMDHNEIDPSGHDVYREGLHVDISRRTKSTVHLGLSHSPLPVNRGATIRLCVNYFTRHAGYFVDVFEEDRPPGSPPPWPDGGGDELSPTLITTKPVDTDMSQEEPAEDILTVDELTEELADATGTTAEEIERQAESVDIAPPEEATVLDE